MNKLDTINEQEARVAVHAALEAKGIKVTKTVVDQVMDTATDLAIAGLSAGKGIKVRGLGTLEVREHAESTYKVPDVKNPGQFLTGVIPAGKHIAFNASDAVENALNAPVTIG